MRTKLLSTWLQLNYRRHARIYEGPSSYVVKNYTPSPSIGESWSVVRFASWESAATLTNGIMRRPFTGYDRGNVRIHMGCGYSKEGQPVSAPQVSSFNDTEGSPVS